MSEMPMKPSILAQARKKAPFFARLAGGLMIALLLTATLATALFSLLNYRPSAGIMYSDWAGLDNFARVCSSSQLEASVNNSLLMKLAQLLGGLLIGLPLTALVCLPRKKPGRVLTLASLCLIPALFPVAPIKHLVTTIFTPSMLFVSTLYTLLFACITALQTGGFYAFCGGMFAYMKRRGVGKGVWQGLLVALLIQALSMFTPDLTASLLLKSNASTLINTTLDLFALENVLMRNNYGRSAAVSVIKLAMQCAVAVVPALFLSRIARADTNRIDLPRAKRSSMTVVLALAFWGVVVAGIAVALINHSALPATADEWANSLAEATASTDMLLNLFSSVVVAVFGGMLAAFAGYGIICQGRNSRITFIPLVILLASALSGIAGEMALAISGDLYRTLVLPILRVVFDPRLIMLMLVMIVILRMAPERSLRGLGAMLFFAAAACAWSDLVSSYMYLSSPSEAPLALNYFYLLNGFYNSAESVTSSVLVKMTSGKIVAMAFQAIPAVLLSIVAALQCIRCFRDAQPVTVNAAEEAVVEETAAAEEAIDEATVADDSAAAENAAQTTEAPAEPAAEPAAEAQAPAEETVKAEAPSVIKPIVEAVENIATAVEIPVVSETIAAVKATVKAAEAITEAVKHSAEEEAPVEAPAAEKDAVAAIDGETVSGEDAATSLS